MEVDEWNAFKASKANLALSDQYANDGIIEGCPIHPTRVDSSLVFAIRLTGSRFARDLENIASRVYTRWVENVVDLTQFD